MNNKPITILRDEFIQKMVDLCNNADLPFFVVEDVLKNLLQEIHSASLQQLESDKKRYKLQEQQQENK